MDTIEQPAYLMTLKGVVIIGFALVSLLGTLILLVFFKHSKKVQAFERNLRDMQTKYEKALLTVQKEIVQQVLNDISMELHDNISHQLVLLRHDIESLNEGDLTKNDLLKHVNNIIVTTKNLSLYGFKLPKIKDSIIQSIKEDIERINKSKKIKIEFELGEFQMPLNELRKLYIFRVYQELITNVLKHSYAKKATVKLTGDDNNFILIVIDNGIGFDPTQTFTDRQGLEGIKSKCKLIQGSCVIESKNNSGTIVTIHIPLVELNNEKQHQNEQSKEI